MRFGDIQLGRPAVDYTDTKGNIEALVGTLAGARATATDNPLAPFGSFDGTTWHWSNGYTNVSSGSMPAGSGLYDMVFADSIGNWEKKSYSESIAILDNSLALLNGDSAAKFKVADPSSTEHAVSLGALETQSKRYFTTTGTSTAYVITGSYGVGDTTLPLTTNERWTIKFHVACGASPTLNRDGLGAKAIQYIDNWGFKVNPTSEIISMGKIYDVMYDGTYYLIMCPDVQRVNEVHYSDVSSNPHNVTAAQAGAFTVVPKPLVEIKNSDTVIADDLDLTVTLAASKNYAIRGRIFYDTSAAADFQYRFQKTSATTRARIRYSHMAPGDATLISHSVETAFPTTTTVVAGTASGGYIEFDMQVQNGASSAVVSFQWAQNTSDAADTRVLPGSYIEYCKVN